METQGSTNQRTAIWLILLTLFIDFVGFGLIIPLLPFWAEKLGANAISVGLLMTLYALAQFIFTPMLGELSDRHGRKKIIFVSLMIEVVALVLSALAQTLPMLFFARVIGGLGASNIGSAQAVISDITAPEQRAKHMGMIGAAIGVGFVVGPALSGLLTPLGITVPLWVAAGGALINALLVFFFLPETNQRTHQQREHEIVVKRVRWPLLNWGILLKQPLIFVLVCTNLLYVISFAAMESIFSLFSQATFGWGAVENGYVFTYVGVIMVIVQGGLIFPLIKRFGESSIMLAGLFLMALGLIVLAFSTQFALLLVALALLSVGNGFVSPTVSTLLSFASTKDEQGKVLGLSQGFGGLGRIIGPLIAGGLYTLGRAFPFIGGGALTLIAALVALPTLLTLRKVQTKKASW